MVLDGSVRRQDSASTLALLLSHRDTGAGTWKRIKGRWDEVVAAIDPGDEWHMLDLVYHRSEPGVAADIAEWLTANPLPGTGRYIAQQLDRLEIRVALRRPLGRELGETLQP